jgi:hypothetical protein
LAKLSRLFQNHPIYATTPLCMLRYKKIIGTSMKAREIPQQKTEGGIGVRVLNRMTALGMPESVKAS